MSADQPRIKSVRDRRLWLDGWKEGYAEGKRAGIKAVRRRVARSLDKRNQRP